MPTVKFDLRHDKTSSAQSTEKTGDFDSLPSLMTFAALEKQKSSLMRLGPIRSPPADLSLEPSTKSS